MSVELLKRVVTLVFGLTFIGFGGALFILSHIGSDPFNVFMQGISNVTGLTVGQSNMMISFSYALLILFLDKSYIRIGTVIAIVGIGSMTDIGIHLFTFLFADDPGMVFRLMTMMIGCTLIALGVATIYCANIGMVPNDALPVILSARLKIPFKWFRIGYDFLAVIIGVILGGIFGIGTIVCAMLTGPLISFFIPWVNRFTQLYLSEGVQEI